MVRRTAWRPCSRRERTRPHDPSTLTQDPVTAAFFLPGLLHQFGNLLLTVQGQVLHVADTDLQGAQQAVGAATQRGAATLQVMRALLGERSGTPGEARVLLAALGELARLPARDRGLSVELRIPDDAAAWLCADTFVAATAAALRAWLEAVPVGASGQVPIELYVRGSAVIVSLHFEPGTGSLPFPIPRAELAAALGPAMADANGCIRHSDSRFELQFRAGEAFLQQEA